MPHSINAPSSNKTLIIICGPTAVGKTTLAINLAKKLSTEIISADSRQFFRELTIGTAKPSIKELNEVKHHLINSLSVYDDYNVGVFEKDALGILKNIFNKKDKAIMVGGSGLYIQAICNGFDEVPSANKEVRKQIIEQYEKEGIEYLRTTLKKLDEEYYNKVDLSNPHR
ncbi:MAG TPA: tRNA (adenosine(37)-N6)-dimethylallyltransferase MiaA, partial [Bacteroidia bacterium]|nr:tRNA (adenosine(37)-N6)-dimethylallyltransferase MiaA [Bacteroidia bacterium]